MITTTLSWSCLLASHGAGGKQLCYRAIVPMLIQPFSRLRQSGRQSRMLRHKQIIWVTAIFGYHCASKRCLVNDVFVLIALYIIKPAECICGRQDWKQTLGRDWFSQNVYPKCFVDCSKLYCYHVSLLGSCKINIDCFPNWRLLMRKHVICVDAHARDD